MRHAIHTSDTRHFKKLWLDRGGFIFPIDGTGEVRYVHAEFPNGIRANSRRKDVPAKLLSCYNQIIRREAANDPQMG